MQFIYCLYNLLFIIAIPRIRWKRHYTNTLYLPKTKHVEKTLRKNIFDISVSRTKIISGNGWWFQTN